MLTRALIVVLVILNLGVALWWLLRAEPVSEPPASPVGVAQLEVLPSTQAPPAALTNVAPALQDVTPAPAPAAQPPATTTAPPTVVAATPAPTPAATAPAVATATAAALTIAPPAPVAPPAAPAQCVSLGPFADRATAQAA
ncbi:MAG: SPOR domain-containing protein, partial [Stenotrophomonas maltophilia]